MPVAAISVHGIPRACRFSLHGASRPKSGATPSMAALAAAQTRYLLISDAVGDICVLIVGVTWGNLRMGLGGAVVGKLRWCLLGLCCCSSNREDDCIELDCFYMTGAAAVRAINRVNKCFGVGVTSAAMDGAAPELNPGWVRRRKNSNSAVR